MAKKMTVEGIKKLNKPGLHKDIEPGLYLKIRKPDREGGHVTKSWIVRWKLRGTNTQRAIGLGSIEDMPLPEAREAARDIMRLVQQGKTPDQVRKEYEAQRDAGEPEQPDDLMTFEKAAGKFIDTKIAPESKAGSKTVPQWKSSLETYTYPIIGKMVLDDITTDHVLQIVEPLWSTKTETGTRVLQRISRVMDWARVMKLRTGDNPARYKGYLDQVLATPDKIRKRKHFESLPYSEVHDFLADLRQRPATSARCLELIVLTGTRSQEAREARWEEIDWDGKQWNIPVERMKAGKPHRVPLSKPAIKLLKKQKGEHDEFIFPGERKKGPLSINGTEMLLRRMDRKPLTTHGFRSTFRTWAAEKTNYPREVCEQALAHTIGSAVEQSYMHSDLFDRRRKLMNDWAKFLNSKG